MPDTLTREQLLTAYLTMRTIREFEERVHAEFATGEIPGFVHLYAGEEASAAGVRLSLDERDAIASTHRGHGHCIAKGVNVGEMMAEIYGRKTGSCHGKGGSMHIADLSKGMLGANGIVGGGPPLICGTALAANCGTGGVSVAFFGDGGSNQGATCESLNLASVWNLPAIFVAENNGYAESTASAWSVATDNIADWDGAFGMPGVIVDGFDFSRRPRGGPRGGRPGPRGRRPDAHRDEVHPVLRALRGRPPDVPGRGGRARAGRTRLPQALRGPGDRGRLAVPGRPGRRGRGGGDPRRQGRVGGEGGSAAGPADLLTDVYVRY